MELMKFFSKVLKKNGFPISLGIRERNEKGVLSFFGAFLGQI